MVSHQKGAQNCSICNVWDTISTKVAKKISRLRPAGKSHSVWGGGPQARGEGILLFTGRVLYVFLIPLESHFGTKKTNSTSVVDFPKIFLSRQNLNSSFSSFKMFDFVLG